MFLSSLAAAIANVRPQAGGDHSETTMYWSDDLHDAVPLATMLIEFLNDVEKNKIAEVEKLRNNE